MSNSAVDTAAYDLFMTKVAFLWLAAILTLAARPYLSEPALSPDGSEIAFVSGGDIWTVPVTGGIARLLVSHPATESRPLYSPDGSKLAFISARTGNGDTYVLTFSTGDLKRITFDDGLDQLDAWSRDGKYQYFSSSVHDIGGMNDIYRVRVDGGTPPRGERRPLRQRIFRRAVAQRTGPGVDRARHRFVAMMAQRAQPSRRTGDLHSACP